MSDIRGCFVCAQSERADKGLDECYACQSCIKIHIRHYKPQLQDVVLNGAWKCTICCDEQAKGVTVEKFLICKDRLACKDRSKGGSPGRKLSFLQQFDPSPLSSDFTGDVSIAVDGSDECIQAHRFILAGRSRVFKSMMDIDMKEKLSCEIQMKGMSAATVRAAVNFMYTGDIKFSDEVSAEDMLKFAVQYEIQWLKDVCEAQLVKNFSSKNLLEMLSISYRFSAEKLKEVATKYFSDHPDVHKSILNSVFSGL